MIIQEAALSVHEVDHHQRCMPNLQIHKTVAANNCYLKMGIVNNFIPKLIVLLSKVLNILKDFNLLLVFLALFLLFVLVINNSLIWFCLSNHYP